MWADILDVGMIGSVVVMWVLLWRADRASHRRWEAAKASDWRMLYYMRAAILRLVVVQDWSDHRAKIAMATLEEMAEDGPPQHLGERGQWAHDQLMAYLKAWQAKETRH